MCYIKQIALVFLISVIVSFLFAFFTYEIVRIFIDYLDREEKK